MYPGSTTPDQDTVVVLSSSIKPETRLLFPIAQVVVVTDQSPPVPKRREFVYPDGRSVLFSKLSSAVARTITGSLATSTASHAAVTESTKFGSIEVAASIHA